MAKKTKKTKETDQRRCTQVQCGYYLQGGCKPCDDCKSKEFLINTSCNRCLSCENVPGALRWDDPKRPDQQIGHQQVNPEEVKKIMLTALIMAATEELKKMEKQEKVIER